MGAGKLRFLLLLCYTFFQFNITRADIPPLERELNFTVKNEDIKSVLSRIEKQTSVFFSYNPSILGGVTPITASFTKKTVREALSTIFKDKVTYQTRGNYIILKEKTPSQQAKKTKVSGYVYDQSSGSKVANVTIYDPATLRSATSNEYGFYEISLPAPATTLAVNKAEYRDTTIVTDSAQIKTLNNIAISTGSSLSDTAAWNRRVRELNEATLKALKKLKSYVHTLNVRDTIKRDWQVSFLPYIGTNHKMSGNVYNRLSFNILGGYSRGNTGFEIGGLFNVNRENMSGAQLAGLFNIVGDSVKGFQAAGLMNIRKFSEGAQVAGLMNISSITKGFTGAGLMNITGTLRGVAAAGLANVSANTEGVCVAGLFNIDGAGRSRQVAGLFNIATESDLQIGGLFNVSGKVRGLQLAPFNFADSASGVPVGVLSIVGSGLHQLELSADEIFYANASFRTGVNAFYNILTAGISAGQTPDVWQVGYGIGSSLRFTKKLRGEINMSASHVSYGSFVLATNELLRFHPAIEFRFTKNISIAAGPTFNFYITDDITNDFGPARIKNMEFESIGDQSLYAKYWAGGKISLRFF